MGSKTAVAINSSETEPVDLEQPIDVALTLAMADLKARFMDLDSGKVDYRAMGGSEAFRHYKGLAGLLRDFDLSSLESRDKRLAFWINIYNTAVIHGVIEWGVKESVREISRFFHRVKYEIGGRSFSLNEMEHGILRGNRRPPYGMRKPFGREDPRLAFVVAPMDPRIHFALVCGARSCPPIGFYEPERIDFQLQLAAASFINGPNVRIAPPDETISLSMIFKWYKPDFGGTRGALLDTLLEYLDEGENRSFVEQNKSRIRIKYQPYDWSLNE